MLTAVIRALRRHWLACATAAVLTAVAAFAISLVLTPVYRVELTLSPINDIPGKGGLAALAGQLGGLMAATGLGASVGQAKYEAMALLKSPTFIAAYIQEENLMPVLYPDSYVDGKPVAGEKPPTVNQAVKRFTDSILGVKEDPKSGLLTLRVDWTDPRIALEWAREFVARANEVMRARDIRDAKEGISYLNGELSQTTQVSTREAITRVLQEQLQMSTMANVRREYALKVLDPGLLPDRPARPRKVRMILAGFLLGALVAGFIFCAREGAFSPTS